VRFAADTVQVKAVSEFLCNVAAQVLRLIVALNLYVQLDTEDVYLHTLVPVVQSLTASSHQLVYQLDVIREKCIDCKSVKSLQLNAEHIHHKFVGHQADVVP
jgi:hypothetical protein